MFNWRILVLVLLLSFFSMAVLYAEELSNTKIGFYKSKIAKVESNIKQLKAKLSKAKGKSKAKISKLLSAEQKRVETIKKQLSIESAKVEQPLMPAAIAPVLIATPETVKPAMIGQKPQLARKNYLAQIGLDGGAVALALGYDFAVDKENSVKPIIGYGIGNSYTAIMLNIAVQHIIATDIFAGASLDLASYSNRVRGILGLADTIEKGTAIGVGVEFGRKFGDLIGKFGFSTSLGLTLNAEYKF